MSKSVAIIGGGVAGIAAAVSLAEAGFRVELIEKRPLLGGRASSFLDKQTGQRLDECQHGTMRCCTNLADLLERLGVHDQVRYHDVIRFLDSEGRRSVIKGCGLPAPMHTAASFVAFHSLGARDKLCIARGLIAMLRAKPGPEHDATDVLTWYRRTGQTERAIRRFWEPILVSACNESLERISCAHAFKIFVDGFLANPRAYHFGVPRVPLGTLYTEPTLAYLQKRGGCARLRTIVEQLHFEGDRVAALTLSDGERVEPDYVISALQCDLLLKLLPPEVVERWDYFRALEGIALSPIIGVHLWFDRTLDCPEALSLLDRESDWIFNKTKNWEGAVGGEGTYLSVVISAPGPLAEASREEIAALVLDEVRACVPDAREAKLLRSLVVKWPKATFAPKPGVEALRPDQRSPITNLFVAGEWTRTGWPSTMESAARSGNLAAEYVCAAAGTPRRFLAPDLPRAPLVRLLAGRG